MKGIKEKNVEIRSKVMNGKKGKVYNYDQKGFKKKEKSVYFCSKRIKDKKGKLNKKRSKVMKDKRDKCIIKIKRT